MKRFIASNKDKNTKNIHKVKLVFYRLKYYGRDPNSPSVLTDTKISRVGYEMLLKGRHYSHCEVLIDKTLHWFGLDGKTTGRVEKNNLNDAVFIDLDITDQQYKLILDPMKDRVFTEPNSIKLLNDGYDYSNKFKVFNCSTWLAYCLGLDNYWTYTTDDLFNLFKT